MEGGDEMKAAEGTKGRKKVILFTVRSAPLLKERLTQASEANQRSLSQEIESRLERSFVIEELEGGPKTAAMLRNIELAIYDLEKRVGHSWLVDRDTWSAASAIVREVLGKAGAPRSLTKAMSLPESDRAAPERVPITIRSSVELKQRLERAVELTGRALAKEIETRLEQSLLSEQHKGASATSTFLHLLGASIHDWEVRNGKPWQDGIDSRSSVLRLVEGELRKRRPPAPPVEADQKTRPLPRRLANESKI